jgi:hypothetical protein
MRPRLAALRTPQWVADQAKAQGGEGGGPREGEGPTGSGKGTAHEPASCARIHCACEHDVCGVVALAVGTAATERGGARSVRCRTGEARCGNMRPAHLQEKRGRMLAEIRSGDAALHTNLHHGHTTCSYEEG